MSKAISIIGIRGIPAQHGGFETFAEKLCLYLVNRGWSVTVYCQELEGNSSITESSTWRGINRIHIPVKGNGAFSTVIFDLKVAWHCRRDPGVLLLLGYNTALFNLMQRFFSQPLLINMDGIEWKREKWGFVAKSWFWLNERIGCFVGNHLVADHPKIKEHLSTRVSSNKITTIPYGGVEIASANQDLLERFSIKAGDYSVIIARPEPENSFHEMVKAFSSKKREHKLVVLGKFQPEINEYHRQVISSASDEVIFAGAIYESDVVSALRFYCRFYLHGHQVGGTNPSLVEAMAAGCAVIAHDNQFNRWVVGDGARYFTSEQQLSQLLDSLLHNKHQYEQLKKLSKQRYTEYFTWEKVLTEYESLLLKFC